MATFATSMHPLEHAVALHATVVASFESDPLFVKFAGALLDTFKVRPDAPDALDALCWCSPRHEPPSVTVPAIRTAIYPIDTAGSARVRPYHKGMASVDAITQMPTLPAPVLEFLGAVDAEMLRLKGAHTGKIAGVSAYIRDAFAWRKSSGAQELVDKLAGSVEGLSVGDIRGERGSGPGLGRFAGKRSYSGAWALSWRVFSIRNLIEALH